jgi:hypothetical protein
MAARRQPDDGYLAFNVESVPSESFNSCTANTTEYRHISSVCSTSVEPSAALALIKPVCVREYENAFVRPSAASPLHTATAGSIVPSALGNFNSRPPQVVKPLSTKAAITLA